MNFKLLSFAQNQIRKISTTNVQRNKKSKSHYDHLEISPKATQADVKAAYYKLSMVYHPDKMKGPSTEENSQKFRDISAAYEVLGNVKSRKLYDRGLLVGQPFSPRGGSEPVNKFYKSREVRHRPPAPSGRTPIYDFDEWAKNHYGETFARDLENRRRRERREKEREMAAHDLRMEKAILLLGAFIIIMTLLATKDFDDVTFIGPEVPLHVKKKNDDLRSSSSK